MQQKICGLTGCDFHSKFFLKFASLIANGLDRSLLIEIHTYSIFLIFLWLQLCRGAATALHAVEFATTFVFRHDRSKFSDMLLNTLYFADFQQRAVP